MQPFLSTLDALQGPRAQPVLALLAAISCEGRSSAADGGGPPRALNACALERALCGDHAGSRSRPQMRFRTAIMDAAIHPSFVSRRFP
jgi:hypothetical protein